MPCLGTAQTSPSAAPFASRAGLSAGARAGLGQQGLGGAAGCSPPPRPAPVRGIPMCTAPCTAPARPALGCTAMGSHHPLLGGRGPMQEVPGALLLSCPELSSYRSAPGPADLDSGTGILSIPRESSLAPSCLLPSSTASPQQPPTAVTNTPAARSVPHPPEPAPPAETQPQPI